MKEQCSEESEEASFAQNKSKPRMTVRGVYSWGTGDGQTVEIVTSAVTGFRKEQAMFFSGT